MNPEFWHTRWRENRIGFHQNHINAHLEAHWRNLGVDGGHVFVPLCGKSRDMLWLRDQGHHVLGVEISDIAVQAFFSENGISATRTEQPGFTIWRTEGLTLLQGNFFDLTPDHLAGVTGVFDRAALIALPPADRSRYCAHLLASLPSTAHMLLVTLEYDEREMNGPPFSVPESEVHRHFDAAFAIGLAGDADENRGALAMREKVYILRRHV